jgi:hypothetical protein
MEIVKLKTNARPWEVLMLILIKTSFGDVGRRGPQLTWSSCNEWTLVIEAQLTNSFTMPY